MIIHKEEVFTEIDEDLWSGDVVAECTRLSPRLRWKGAKISWEQYCQMYSFCKWSSEEYKSEAQGRMLYNPTLNKIALLVYPQYSMQGMHTDEIEDHPDKETARAEMMAAGYDTFIGTWHDHDNTGAFQSGTDSKDEIDQPGLHITFGHMDKTEIDLHARLVFDRYQYPDVDICDWIELPNIDSNLPYGLRMMMGKWYLKRPAMVDFPEEWKSRIIEKPKPVNLPVKHERQTCYASAQGGNGKGQMTFSEQKDAPPVVEVVGTPDPNQEIVDEDELMEEFKSLVQGYSEVLSLDDMAQTVKDMADDEWWVRQGEARVAMQTELIEEDNDADGNVDQSLPTRP